MSLICVMSRTSLQIALGVLCQPLAHIAIAPEVVDVRVGAPQAWTAQAPRATAATRQQAMVQSTRRPGGTRGGTRSVKFARISGADARMLNARRPFNCTSPQFSYSQTRTPPSANHGEGDGPVQPALGPVGRALVQVVSDAIEPKHFHDNAVADSAENEPRHHGLANICISAKVSRRVLGRDFSV